MSDIERFWQAMSVKFGCNVSWDELNFMEQQQIIQGVNMILAVMQQLPKEGE